ncbi:hypothetical protein B0H13DRAFT_2367039 [Mycena leptocephala]|nr:hypothetical protein B0H13DRAFT_2367039 [Mycena leptocephala]
MNESQAVNQSHQSTLSPTVASGLLQSLKQATTRPSPFEQPLAPNGHASSILILFNACTSALVVRHHPCCALHPLGFSSRNQTPIRLFSVRATLIALPSTAHCLRAYPRHDRCARPAYTAPRASPPSRPPPPPSSPSLAARLPSRAGALHASQEPAPSCTRRPSSISGGRRNCPACPVYAHSSPRTRTSTGTMALRGAGLFTPFSNTHSHHPLPSLFPRARHALFRLAMIHPPSFLQRIGPRRQSFLASPLCSSAHTTVLSLHL